MQLFYSTSNPLHIGRSHRLNTRRCAGLLQSLQILPPEERFCGVTISTFARPPAHVQSPSIRPTQVPEDSYHTSWQAASQQWHYMMHDIGAKGRRRVRQMQALQPITHAFGMRTAHVPFMIFVPIGGTTQAAA